MSSACVGSRLPEAADPGEHQEVHRVAGGVEHVRDPSASRTLAEASPTSGSATRRTSAASAPGCTIGIGVDEHQHVTGRVTRGVVAAAGVAQVAPGREHREPRACSAHGSRRDPGLRRCPRRRCPCAPSATRAATHAARVGSAPWARTIAEARTSLTLAAGPPNRVRPARRAAGYDGAPDRGSSESQRGWAMRRRGWIALLLLAPLRA